MNKIIGVFLILFVVMFSAMIVHADEAVDWQERALRAEYHVALLRAQLDNCRDQAKQCLQKVQDIYASRVDDAITAARDAYNEYLDSKDPAKGPVVEPRPE